MILAKVKGNLVSTQKNPHLVGYKLLIVHPIDLKEKYIGKKDIVALDMVDAGIGDKVLVVQEGKAVQQILGHRKAPVHSLVVAVVDSVHVTEQKSS